MHDVRVSTGFLAIMFLLMATMAGAFANARGNDEMELGAFEFLCDFYLPIGRCRLHGRLAGEGVRHRLAMYWIEPTPLREGTHFLRYGDFLFSSDVVQYRIDGAPDTQSFRLSGGMHGALLPKNASLPSVVRCVLAILLRMRASQGRAGPPLEIGGFFAGARDQMDHSLEVLPDEGGSAAQGVSDVLLLNTLPYGRHYSKARQDDGSVVWRAQRAMDGRPLFAVTVAPLNDSGPIDWQEAFDPNSLSRWSLVPEAYHAYWSFSRRYSTLADGDADRAAAAALCDEIETYLDGATAPVDVLGAMDRLRLRAALMTGEASHVGRATEAMAARLCRDETVSPYIALLELAQIASQIEKDYPQQVESWLRPLIAQTLERAGDDAARHLQRLISPVVNNKWFAYGRLVLDEARRQGHTPADVLDALAERLETSHMADGLLPFDANEAAPSVKLYLAQLDADPPVGSLTLDDVRRILDEGLAEQYTQADDRAKDAVIRETIRTLRLIVGEGPFRGDADALIASTRRFSRIYLGVRRVAEPMDRVLATLLALSFCDGSTDEDHETLYEQFATLAADLESRVNRLLDEYELIALVGPNDVAQTFAEQEAIFRSYVADPLWPPFKFPLTATERTRLSGKLKLRLEQTRPLFDEMSDKVRYGGVDERLKRRTVYEIARVAEHLMVEAAFLRRPGYPGVSTQYRGGHGFTAVIDGPLYEQGDRARERFKAMKYFHLGHRLEEVVRAERDLATPPRQADSAQEGPEGEQGP